MNKNEKRIKQNESQISTSQNQLSDTAQIFKSLITMLRTNGALTAQNVTDLKALGRTLNIN